MRLESRSDTRTALSSSPHRPPPSPHIAVMQAACLHQHSCPHHHGLSDNCHYCTAQMPREPKQFTGDNPLIKLCPHISIALTFSAKRFHLPHVLELHTIARDPFTGLWPVHDAPCTGLKLCCHHLKILNTFSFCTGTGKLCNCSCQHYGIC